MSHGREHRGLCQKYYILSLFFCGILPVNAIESWSSLFKHEFKDISRKKAGCWFEIKAELKRLSSPLKNICLTKPIKVAFNWRKTNFLLPRFSLLCRQHSSLQAFLDQKNGRKQKCNLIDVTLDDVITDIKQIYNMMLFPIKPPGGLFVSSYLRWAPEGWNFTCWGIWEGWQICHFGW